MLAITIFANVSWRTWKGRGQHTWKSHWVQVVMAQHLAFR